MHGEETVVFADAGYQGSVKRPEATGIDWYVAMRPGKLTFEQDLASLSDSVTLCSLPVMWSGCTKHARKTASSTH